MMKFLTMALGGLTMLTVTGLATPPGQAMLGMRPAQTAAPVSVIADPGPAAVSAPAAPAAAPVSPTPVAAPVHPVSPAPAAAPVAPRVAPRPVAAPAASPAPVARPAAPAPAANPMGGMGAGAITNILLNLPQVLQGTQVGPGGPAVNNGGFIPPGQRAKKHHGNGDQNDETPER